MGRLLSDKTPCLTVSEKLFGPYCLIFVDLNQNINKYLDGNAVKGCSLLTAQKNAVSRVH